ncbi:TetR family transcriptional regulator [Rhodococcus rhodnii]|uniref:TetR family transcriptional regulator n=2 Tax=Rhodococcus rhodnii TaxID=38312 RepID=R7WTL2_9NOCA|nr:TetR/AcrR family transcriptional regulator C-terminal domain-containing protein [Rhodococcus rhodnii]EOM78592.1 TetR family transcriptional regulator [Rhodococcus rhodnii LMG 5362]TXG91373.1 TetR family transcriptional regulator [Rhodococcus rhodnii]
MNLSRSDILDAATAILDEYGLADLTMRRLATSLGVQPGALYWHFPNKQTLLGAVSDRILEDVDAPLTTPRPWDEQVRALAHRLRDALLAHRDGAELVSASYSSRLSNSRARDAFSTALSGGGLSTDHTELASHVLLHFVLGLTTSEQSRSQLEEMNALTRGGISPDAPAVDPERDSDLVTADPAARFEFGLDTFVDGIGQRLAAEVR